MKTVFSKQLVVLATVLLFPIGLSMAAGLQLVSARDNSIGAPAGGNGDSYLSVVTPDGRYVLFTSTADNLVLTNNDGPVPLDPLRPLNVYRRDRANGRTTLVSVNPDGNGGNGNSFPTGISSDGRYAVFESSASDLVSGDANNTYDVFVRDIVNGTTALVSVGTNGMSGDGRSGSAIITPDGRYVAFVSAADNLVANDTNGIPDVFVRDLQTGTTVLASVGAVSANLTNIDLINASESPAMTPDGRYVAFESTATNLTADTESPGGIYVRDLVGGTTVCVSTNAQSLLQSVAGTANAVYSNPAISTNGQFVAYEAYTENSPNTSGALGIVLRYNLQTGTTDIVSTNASQPLTSPLENINTEFDMTPDGRFIAFAANTNSTENAAIYLWDAQAGTNLLISADTNGLPATGFCIAPEVISTGQSVGFLCNATNLTTNTFSEGTHLYLRDVQSRTTQSVDVDTNGVGIGVDAQCVPALSDDGSLIFFECNDGSLVANDWNRAEDVFVRDLTNGTTELISVHNPMLPSEAPNALSELFSTSVSANGRYIAFSSEANDLVLDDTNGYVDVFLQDTLSETNILVNDLTNQTNPGPLSGLTNVYKTFLATIQPSISGDGRYVVFTGVANFQNDVPGDQVFLRDLQTGTTELVSSNYKHNGTGFGDGNSFLPTVSNDGRFILYHSKADNLTTNSVSLNPQIENLFLHDRQYNTNYALTTASSGIGITSASMTPDGRYVAYIGIANGNGANNLYVWDSQAAKIIYTNTSSYLFETSISADGRWVAYATSAFVGSTLNAYNLVGRTNCFISNGSFSFHAGLQFSADDRFLVFSTQSALVGADMNGAYDVYLHDFQTGSNLLVSESFDSADAADGASDWPVLSPDGRFVAYRSRADNIVPGDSNGVGDLFLYDRSNNATMLVSVSQTGNSTANSWSASPAFSGDSKTLVFESYAGNLPAPGFNEFNAIYALNLAAPTIVDSDHDGMDDNWEMEYFGTLARDGTGDYDNDGASDLFEFLTGTDPTNPNSKFDAEISGTIGAGQSPTINWPLAPGRSYRVQYKDSLDDTNWQDVDGSLTLVGNAGRITDLAPASGQRFYRIVLEH